DERQRRPLGPPARGVTAADGRSRLMLIRRAQVPEVAEPENALMLRELVGSEATSGDVSATWVRLSGRHRRLRSVRSTRIYYVLTGSARFAVGDEESVEAHAGDAVVIPRGAAYEIEGNLTYLVVNGPGFVVGDDQYL